MLLCGRFYVLRTRLDLVPLQGQRSVLPAKSGIHSACITQLSTSFTSSPHRSVASMTVRALRTRRIPLRVLRLFIVDIGIDELLRSEFIPLLAVQTAGITQRTERRRFSSPQRRGSGMTVRAHLHRTTVSARPAGGRFRRDAGQVLNGRW